MSSTTGNRSSRPGAHRAPRSGSPVRMPRAEKATGEGGKTGLFGVGLRSKSMVAKAAVVLVLAVIVGVGVADGGASSAEPTVYQFLLDWEQGQYQQAAALTTGPPQAVATELATAYRQVDATGFTLSMGHISQQGDNATAAFRASVDLGNVGIEWRYSGQFALRQVGSGWKVVWGPAVIMPGLQNGEGLGVVFQLSPRALIYTAARQPLITTGLTYEIGVIPGTLRGAEITTVAQELAAIEPTLQWRALAGQINASQTSPFQPLVTLSPSQYDAVASKIQKVSGLAVHAVEQPLFDSIAPDVTGEIGTEISPVLQATGARYQPGTTVGLSGLQEYFQRQLTGTPTIEVYVEKQGQTLYFAPAAGGIARWQGLGTKGVYTTINLGVQKAANNALAAQQPGSAAIVAVEANTGKVLAVSSSHDPGWPALDPLGGAYEPGQAFTMISSAAILATGQVNANSPEPCGAHNQVNGRTFANDPPEPARLAASSTVEKDFAVGCSTAFAELSQVRGSDLASTAAEFGIGEPWEVPLPAGSYNSGTIGQAVSPDQTAADAIGQGTVRVSPLSMALAAATADSGRWHAPRLVVGGADPSATTKSEMSAAVLSALQGLMRDAVAHGNGSQANVGSDVHGQTGSAPFSKRYSISWFVGYQGNIAFAVAELVPSPSDSAAGLAGSFLRNIHAGS